MSTGTPARTASAWLALIASIGLGVIAGSASVHAADSGSLRGFHIGNSLTGNLMPHGLEDSLGRNGIPASIGWHIDYSQSAASVVANPQGVGGLDGLVPFYGAWPQALREHAWDYVAIQSYFGPSGLLEVAGIQALIDAARSNPANAGTRILLYSTWLWNDGLSNQPSYATLWDKSHRTLSQAAEPNARFFRRMLRRLRIANPSVAIGVIPVGEVFATVDALLRRRPVEESDRTLRSSWDLYQDRIHLGKQGCYIAHLTTVVTILNRHPDGISLDPVVASSVSEELKALVHPVIWTVVLRSNRAYETNRE